MIGLSVLGFYVLLQLCTHLLLEASGVEVPKAAGEVELVPHFFHHSSPQPWLLVLMPAIGGLVSGLLVYRICPEAEGHGTDAAIIAYHTQQGLIRTRVPVVKAVASALVIGSGGSAGPEGPCAQIGSGVASIIARVARMRPREREILLACGMAAGIGAIFKTPLGGAVFGAEVLYVRDYEVEVLIPSIIATVTAYIVFALFTGFGHIFSKPAVYTFSYWELPFATLLGALCGLLARGFVLLFYRIREFFSDLYFVPRELRPMLGGLVVGILALIAPQCLGDGKGWVQLALNGKLPLHTLLLACIAKIIATCCTLGSGGSGGIFAPLVVIGGFFGASFGLVLHMLVPQLVPNPWIYVILGIGCMLSGAMKIPLAAAIMVAEMTETYHILPAAFLASTVAFLTSGVESVNEGQPLNRGLSPLHLRDHIISALYLIRVEEILRPEVPKVLDTETLAEVERKMLKARRLHMPVVNRRGRIVGIVTIYDLLRVPPVEWSRTRVKDVIRLSGRALPCAKKGDSLLVALALMTKNRLHVIPVIDPKTRELIGEISYDDIVKAIYYKALGS